MGLPNQRKKRTRLHSIPFSRTRQVRRVPADQPVRASRPSDCTPRHMARSSMARPRTHPQTIWRLKGQKSMKIARCGLASTVTSPFRPKTSLPHSGRPPERVGKTCSHVGDGRGSSSQKESFEPGDIVTHTHTNKHTHTHTHTRTHIHTHTRTHTHTHTEEMLFIGIQMEDQV